ncbi:MAG: PD-(D/E)XK nuclease family protein [Ilumatobacteraceae bacterium]
MKLIPTGDGEFTMPVRQSDLNSFYLCPEQARLKFTGALPSRTTEAMALGTAVHAGSEAVLAHGATRTEAIDVIAWQLENLFDGPDFEMVKLDTDQYFRYAFMCFDAWFDHIRPVIGDVVAVEQTFKLPFAEFRLANDLLVKVELHGTIDCVTHKAIWDWKTSNSSWRSNAWERERWAVQPTIYTWAAQELGLDTDPTTFSYGVARTPKAKCISSHDLDGRGRSKPPKSSSPGTGRSPVPDRPPVRQANPFQEGNRWTPVTD